MGQHLRNIAQGYMRQLKITNELVGALMAAEESATEDVLVNHFGEGVRARLRLMQPATLGRIAAQGRLWLFDPKELIVSSEEGMTRGKDVLLELACRSVLAEIRTVLDIKNLREQELM